MSRTRNQKQKHTPEPEENVLSSSDESVLENKPNEPVSDHDHEKPKSDESDDDKVVVKKLYHIHRHFDSYDEIVQKVKSGHYLESNWLSKGN